MDIIIYIAPRKQFLKKYVLQNIYIFMDLCNYFMQKDQGSNKSRVDASLPKFNNPSTNLW